MTISNNSTGLRPGVCTSTSRPTNPYNGQMIYETDSKKTYFYNGAAWAAYGDWSSAQTVSPKTSSYVVTNSDAGSIIVMSNSSVAVTITINATTALAVGQKIDFIGLGNAGTITFVASGVSIYATPGLKFRAVGSSATLVCIIAGVYVLLGDLSA